MRCVRSSDCSFGISAGVAAVAEMLVVLFMVLVFAFAAAADPDPARAARLQALAADQASVRQTIAGLQPAAAALEALVKKTAEADRPLLDAAVAARKNAVEVGTAYLALLVPETDPDDIEVVSDRWVESQNELELANLAVAYAHARADMATRKGPEQAAAAVKMQDVLERDNARLAARKALLAANLRLRIVERHRRVAGRTFAEVLSEP